jgi:hypothetical protein
MRLIKLLLTFLLWIDNQFVSFAAQTSTIDTTDLEDGHPNHQLWRKMVDLGRPSYSDR